MSGKAKLAAAATLLGAVLVAAVVYRKSVLPEAGGRANDRAATGAATTQPHADRPSATSDGEPPGDIAPGFREQALEAGADFRMQFLPGEQGAAFKINLYDHGSGLAVGDYDGDGHDDVYFLNELGANALYRNAGDGTFAAVDALARTLGLDDRVCAGATFADYDNDGDQDLYVTSTRGGNVLFRNDGQGGFADVTAELGLSLVAHSQGAAFFDYDTDGDLDLFVTNTARWTTDEFREAQRYYVGPTNMEFRWTPIEPNRLYRNDGPAGFTDVTAQAGLQGQGWAADTAVFDYDQDGRLDLYVSSMFGRDQLYHNEGHGRFRDVTQESLGRTPFGTIGIQACDLDNDGRLDLFVTDMHSDMWMGTNWNVDLTTIREDKRYPTLLGPETADPPTAEDLQAVPKEVVLEMQTLLFGNALYRNLGGGKFEEISQRAGTETFWPWGVAAGDFDNDGDLDLFLPSGMGYPFGHWPNRLLMNRGDATFVERSRQYGIEPPPRGIRLPQEIGGQPAFRSSRCAAVADFDGDGRLDLMVNNFNDQPYYFRNVFPKQNYLAFRLTGTRSNRDAIGAVVQLRLGDRTMVRQVAPAGGYLSQPSKTLHFGLGDRDQIDRAEIRWPSGQTQTLQRPQLNRLHEIEEPR